MKTRLLIILGMIFSSGFIIVDINTIPELDFEQAFRYSDYVILGKIESHTNMQLKENINKIKI